MKNILLALIFGVLGFAVSNAQEYRSFSAGPYLGFKAGVNGGNVMDGRKNAFSFVKIPDFGVNSLILLSQENDLGVGLGLGYSSYGYKIKGINVGKEYNLTYSYLNFSSEFYFQGITMGFNFGYPIAADYGAKIDVSKIAIMSEFKIGYIYPIMYDEDEGSSLNIYINAGYMLSQIYTDFAKDDPLLQFIPEVAPEKISSKFNPRAVSVSLGMTYWFGIDH